MPVCILLRFLLGEKQKGGSYSTAVTQLAVAAGTANADLVVSPVLCVHLHGDQLSNLCRVPSNQIC